MDAGRTRAIDYVDVLAFLVAHLLMLVIVAAPTPVGPLWWAPVVGAAGVVFRRAVAYAPEPPDAWTAARAFAVASGALVALVGAGGEVATLFWRTDVSMPAVMVFGGTVLAGGALLACGLRLARR